MFNGTPVDIKAARNTSKFSEEELMFENLRLTNPVRYYELTKLREISDALKVLASYRSLSKGIITRTVTVGATPIKLVSASESRSYTIINPTPAVGLTNSFTLKGAGTILNADGNSQATAIGCANYDSIHLVLNITAVGGAPAVDMWAQTIDPLTGTWIDVQYIAPVGGFGAIGTYYNFFSGLGVNTQFALRWASAAWGSLTCSIGYTLKNGLGGSSTGQTQTLYIGNAYVTKYTGYPLLEGQYRDWYMKEGSELYGVLEAGSTNINIIEYV